MYAYNPRMKSYELLDNSMVGEDKWEILDNILQEMNIRNGEKPKQHWMIIGPRGIGKSHLMTLLYHKIKSDDKLDKKWISVLFPEELLTEGTLVKVQERILKEIISELGENKNEFNVVKELRDKMGSIKSYPLSDRVDHYFSLISELHIKTGKYIIIISENLQQLLGKRLSLLEQKKMRAFLQTCNALLIVGSATTIFDALHDHSHPFYNFFHIRRLRDLTFEEMRQLIADILEEKKLANAIEKMNHKIPRLKAIYSFTGGNPRLTVFLADILITEVPDEMIELMDRILDDLTPYFLSIIEGTPDYLLSIINTLAAFKPAQSPMEIAELLELPPSTVRNYIKQLRDSGYVRVAFSKGLSNYYCLNEYLYRLWFQMRNGGHKEHHRWLLDLLVILYSREAINEQKKKLDSYISNPSAQKLRKLFDQAAVFIEENPAYYSFIQFSIDSLITDGVIESKELITTIREENLILRGITPEKSTDTATPKKSIPKYDDEVLLSERVQHFIDNRVYKKAIKACKEFISKNPGSETAYLYWGRCLVKQKKYEDAIEKYKRIIRFNLRPERGYLFWGECLKEQGRHEEAWEKYTKALRLNPKSEEGYLFCGEFLREQKNYGEAIEYLKKAIETNSKSDKPFIVWGECLREQGQYHEAAKNFEKATELNPNSGQGYLLLGECLWKLNRYEEAGKNYKKVIEFDSKSEQGLKGYGEYLWQDGKKEDAIAHFNKIIDGNAWSAEGYRVLGEYLGKDGRQKEAAKNFEKMLEINPDFDTGYRTYGEFLWKTGRRKEALDKFEVTVKRKPLNVENYRIYGEYLWKSGNYTEAIHQFEKIIEVNPFSRQGYEVVLKLSVEDEKYEEAIAFFERHMPEIKEQLNLQSYVDSSNKGQLFSGFLKEFEDLIYNKPLYYGVYLQYGKMLEKSPDKIGALLAYLKYTKAAVESFGAIDVQELYGQYIGPLLNSFNIGEYVEQLYVPKKKKLSEIKLVTLLLLLDNYDIIKERILQIITRFSKAKGQDKREIDILIFTIKLSIWLKLAEGNLPGAMNIAEIYYRYIKMLGSSEEKRNELLTYCLDLYSIQIKSHINKENIERAFEQIKIETEIPLSDILFRIWICLSDPNSTDAQRYMCEKPIEAFINKLKEMAQERQEKTSHILQKQGVN